MSVERLRVTEEHLLILKNLKIAWQYRGLGGPGVDIERPFGSSNVVDDLARILSLENQDEDMEAYLSDLYTDMTQCLQILIQCLGIEEGIYQREKKESCSDWGSWQLAEV